MAIIGNLFLIVTMMISSITMAASLNLRLTTIDGTPTSSMTVGVSYILELIGSGLDTLPTIQIPGLETVHAESRGAYQTISTINGKTQRSIQISYTIRADKPGTYTFGPLEIDYGTTRLTSPQITVQALVETKKNHGNQEPNIFLELTADEESIFIGQPINLTLNFYARSDLAITQCSNPVINSPLFVHTNWQLIAQGVTRHNTISYRYVQWKTQIVPPHAEQLIIPAAHLICVSHKQTTARDLFQAIKSHFGFSGAQQKEIFSNPLTINVESLPPYKGTVEGIGSFDALSFSINPSQAQVGDGIIATLRIIGGNDLNRLQPPSLQLPEGLRFYPSKTTMEKEYGTPGKYTKICEYIIQATQPGDYTIPIQSLTTFDYQKKIYTTLTTEEPVYLSISPAKQSQQKSSSPSITSPLPQSSVLAPELNRSGPWLARPSKIIPWRLFFLLLFAPLLLYSGIIAHWAKTSIQSRPKTPRAAVAQAYERIIKAEQDHHPQLLYEIFMELNSNIIKIPAEIVAEADIEEFMRIFFSEKEFHSWTLFMHECAKSSYSPWASGSPALFESAKRWIALYRERVK